MAKKKAAGSPRPSPAGQAFRGFHLAHGVWGLLVILIGGPLALLAVLGPVWGSVAIVLVIAIPAYLIWRYRRAGWVHIHVSTFDSPRFAVLKPRKPTNPILAYFHVIPWTAGRFRVEENGFRLEGRRRRDGEVNVGSHEISAIGMLKQNNGFTRLNIALTDGNYLGLIKKGKFPKDVRLAVAKWEEHADRAQAGAAVRQGPWFETSV